MTDQPHILAPPPGWEPVPAPGAAAFFLPAADVMSNFDGQINAEVAERLAGGGCWAGHSAWNFKGVVWFDGGRWHEQVSEYHAAVDSFSADTLADLMKLVNDEYGWS